MLTRLAALTAALISTAALAAASDFPAERQPVAEFAGEQLDPASYGPGYIEDMQIVIERDILQRLAELMNPKDVESHFGVWAVPAPGAARHASSGSRYVINKWGATHMFISFPAPVDLHGAFVAGQGDLATAATCLRAIGYRDGQRVVITDWFVGLSAIPQWLDLELNNIDRVELEAMPVYNGAAWYALDDLTYTSDGLTTVLDFEDTAFKQDITGTDYAGLIWEEGSEGLQKLPELVPQPRSQPLPQGDSQQSDDAGGLVSGVIPPPDLLFSFEAVRYTNSYPPDTCGAIGPNHFVEAVNRNLAIYNRTSGAQISNVGLGSFLPGSNGDPRILFDQHSQRWIVLVTDFDDTHFLAVSRTDDPTGQWFKTSWNTSQGSDAGCWPDYPTLGVDANGIYTSSYMIGSGCNGMTIFALDKAPLVADNPALGAVTAFRDLPFEAAIQPAHTYGTPNGQYLISTSSGTTLRVRRILPPLTLPILQDLGTVSVPSYSDPPTAPALGSSTNINTVDRRLMNAVYINGSIYAAHCIAFGGKAACRWYQVRASNLTLTQYGTVTDATRYYYDPGIAVNAQEDVLLGFSGSKSSEYVGAYYCGRSSGDPLGQMSIPALMKAGEAAYERVDGSGRNRWGDYSLSTVDPLDNTTFWTIQEYAESPANVWGTWVGKLEVVPAPLIITLPNGAPTLLAPGTPTVFSVIIEDGAETLVPGSAFLRFRVNGGAFQDIALTPAGGSNFTATLPASTCDETLDYYIVAEGSEGTIVTNPIDAPAVLYTAQVGVATTIVSDNFETDLGWGVSNQNVTAGAWVRAIPSGSNGERGDPPDDFDGSGRCWVTGNAVDEDLDGGPTRLTSPIYDLSAPGDYTISYARWHRSYNGVTDVFTVEVSNNGGLNWTTVETAPDSGGWEARSFDPAAYVPLSANMRLRFTASDNPNDSVNEGGLDAVRIVRFECADIPGCAGDLTGDGVVCQDDLGVLLGDFGCIGAQCTGDADNDGDTDQGDLGILLAEFNTCGGTCP
jgi:hypothetical protein